MEVSTPWHEVILSICGTNPNDWDVNITIRWSHQSPWKAIAQVFPRFFQHTHFVVDDGERICFGKICDEGNNLCVYNILVFSKLSYLKISLSQLSLASLLFYIITLIFVTTSLIQRLGTSKDSSPLSFDLSPSTSKTRA